jgi:minimal PKS chain-length factor (CLF/KS beta)
MPHLDDAVVISSAVPVSCFGTGRASWDALLRGESGITKITRFDVDDFPVKVAGEVLEPEPSALLERRLQVATDRWTQLGLITADAALTAAAADPTAVGPEHLAVVTAAGSGGNEFGQREIEALWSRGPRTVTVYQSIAWFYAATTGQVSIRHGSKGVSSVLAGGAAVGLDVFAKAARLVDGGSELVLVGGTEAGLSPYALVCQLGRGALSMSADPTTAYQPFGAGAAGYVVGEGGAMCVVERARTARRRGTNPLAVVAGHGASHDGRRRGTQDVELAAQGLAEAIGAALEAAHLRPGDLDVVFADGQAAPERDQAEVAALHLALGGASRRVPVTVPQAATGRMEAAGACFAVALAATALAEQVIPPTVNVAALQPTAEVDLVREARPARLRHALVLARSHGGANAAVVLTAAA